MYLMFTNCNFYILYKPICVYKLNARSKVNKENKPHRWTPIYNPEDILQVVPTEGELKTSTIKNRLAEINPLYSQPTKEWFRRALNKLALDGKVIKIKKEDEIADYWRKL
jgi:hypothetical protein